MMYLNNSDPGSENEDDVEFQTHLQESGNEILDCEHAFTCLYEQLLKHGDKWSTIASHLGFRQHELRIIQAKPLLLNDAPESWLRTMLSEWLEWAPGDSRGSGDFATLNGLKKALNKAGLRETALSLKA